MAAVKAAFYGSASLLKSLLKGKAIGDLPITASA